MKTEELRQALIDFNKADHIEKTAKALRENARQKLLTAFEEGEVSPVMFLQDEPGAKSWEARTTNEDGGVVGARITIPTKKGQPSQFDQSEAERLYRLLEDVDTAALGTFDVSFVLNEERWMAYLREQDEAVRGKLAALMLPFVLPSTPDEEMAPRVTKL